MPFQMQININSGVSPDTAKLPSAQDVWASLQRRVSVDASPLHRVSFDPSLLAAKVGDQIFWTNNDRQPHWPGLKNEDGSIDDIFFMPYQIAGDDTSPTFSPGVAGRLEYVCSIHRDPPCSEAGTIEVTPTLEVLVHLQGIGDLAFRDNEFAGTRGQSRRLEGFQLQISPPVAGLSMRYMAHLQGIGDVPFVNEGQFVGTRGQCRRLEGFAIELTGPVAANFDVVYMAHLQGTGDTGIFRNGQFCGTRGQSRRVEGILVRVKPR